MSTATLTETPPRERWVIEYPTIEALSPRFPPHSGELPPLHGAHRAGLDGTRPMAQVLAEHTPAGQWWELHPWAHGRHHQPMQGRGWAVAIGLTIVGLLLLAVLALTRYEHGAANVAPSHGAPAPATTGQTPTPPVAGRGAR